MTQSCSFKTAVNIAHQVSDRLINDSLGVAVPFDDTIVDRNLRFSNAHKEAVKVARHLNKVFKTETFGKVASLNTTYRDSVGVHINIPKALEKAFEIKNGKAVKKDLDAVTEDYVMDNTQEDRGVEADEVKDEMEIVEEVNNIRNVSEVYIQDDMLSESALLEQERRDYEQTGWFSSVNNVPPYNPNSPQISNTIATVASGEYVEFSDAIEAKISIKNKIEEEIDQLKYIKNKSDRQKEALSNLYDLYNGLDKEIANSIATDAEKNYAALEKEIEDLKEILTLMKEGDPMVALEVYEQQEFLYRVEVLSGLLNTKGSVDLTNTEDAIVRGLENGSTKLSEIRDSLHNLMNEFENSKAQLIVRMVTGSTSYIETKKLYFEKYKDDKKRLKDAQENFRKVEERIQQHIEEVGEHNPNNLAFYTLPAHMISSIYPQLLEGHMLFAEQAEKQKTKNIITTFNTTFDKIKNIKVNGVRIEEILFEKDEFGVTKYDKIIKPFNSSWYDYKSKKFYKLQSIFRTERYRNGSGIDTAYKNLISSLKQNTEVISYSLLPEVYEVYAQKNGFEKYFKSSEKDRNDYKTNLVSLYGKTIYGNMVEEALKKIEDYEALNEPQAIKFNKNPFEFHSYYNSPKAMEKNATIADYMDPKYVTLLPKDVDKHRNEALKNIEFVHKDFDLMYHSLEQGLDYMSSAFGTSSMELGRMSSEAHKTIFDDLLGHGKVSKKIAEFVRFLYKPAHRLKLFFNKGKHIKRDTIPLEDREVSKGYSNYGENIILTRSEILRQKGGQYLEKEARRFGLSLATKPVKKKGEVEEHFEKKLETYYDRLAYSLATHEFNQETPIDVKTRFNLNMELAQSYNTRKNTKNIVDFVLSFLKDRSQENKITSYISVWAKNNLIKDGYIDAVGFESRKISDSDVKILGKKLKNYAKTLTQEEKEMVKFLKKEAKNFGKTNLKFEYDNKIIVYDGAKNKGYITNKTGKKVRNLSSETVEHYYGKYLDEKIDSLGKSMTWGAVLLGLGTRMYSVYLSLNPVSGAGNRLAGKTQNNRAAASGLYGFDEEDLRQSRKFLAGANTYRMTKDGDTSFFAQVSKLSGIGNYAHRMEQLEILQEFAERMGLIDQQYKEIMDQYDVPGMVWGSLNEKMSVVSVGNPEFKNQSEIMIAMMMNIEIERVNPKTGVIEKVPLFNPATFELPFEKETGRLKPEFDTENNRASWGDSESVENKVFVNRYKTIRDRLHGAYGKNSRIALEETVLGKLSTNFKKWQFANTANEWGTKDIDLTTYTTDWKGRKVPFLQSPGLANSHIIMSLLAGGRYGKVIGALATAIGGAPVIAIGALGTAAVGTAYGFYLWNTKNRLKKGLKVQRNSMMDEAKIASNYIAEVAVRTARTSVRNVSRGRFNPLTGTLEKLQDQKYHKLNEHDRRLVSESAQGIADNLVLGMTGLLVGYIANAILTSLLVDDDEDEKVKIAQMREVDKYINTIMDTINGVRNSAAMVENLALSGYNMADLALTGYLEQVFLKPFNTLLENNGDDGYFGNTSSLLNSVLLTGIIGVPNQLRNLFEGDVFQRDKMYETPFYFNTEAVKESFRPENLNHERSYKKKRKNNRSRVSKTFRKRIKELLPEMESERLKLMTSSVTTQYYDYLGIKKTKGVSYKDLDEKVDWEAVEELSKQIKIESFIIEADQSISDSE